MSKNKELIKLQREWYKKLKDEGFEDTEYFDANFEPRDIQKKDTYKHALEIKDKYVSTSNHYTYARQLLHTGQIPEEKKRVWELYSEGVPYRTIASEVQISFSAVKKIIDSIIPLLKEYAKSEAQYREENNLI